MFTTAFFTMCSLLIIIGIGYNLSKRGIINDDLNDRMSYILTNYTLPCTVFTALQVNTSLVSKSDIFIALKITVFYFILVIGISYVICNLLKVKDEKNGVIISSLAFGNFGFMAFPLLANVLGSDSSFYVALGQIPFNILFFTLGVYFLATDNTKEKFKFRSMISPGLVAVILGLVFFINQWSLHMSIGVGVVLLSKMTSPVSLIILGHFLSKIDLKDTFKDFEVYIVAFIKLFILPFIFLFLFIGESGNNMLLKSTLSLFAMPTGTLIAIFARKYKADEVLASKIIFMTTIGSAISIPIFMYIMENYV